MTHLWQAELGERLYEACVYYDDGDNPIAVEGPSTYTTSEHRAEAFARQALRGRAAERPGGFWYASIRRGRVTDPSGDVVRAFDPERGGELLAPAAEPTRRGHPILRATGF